MINYGILKNIHLITVVLVHLHSFPPEAAAVYLLRSATSESPTPPRTPAAPKQTLSIFCMGSREPESWSAGFSFQSVPLWRRLWMTRGLLLGCVSVALMSEESVRVVAIVMWSGSARMILIMFDENIQEEGKHSELVSEQTLMWMLEITHDIMMRIPKYVIISSQTHFATVP